MIIGFLFECKDMSKSYNRYNPCTDIESVMEAMASEWENEAQRVSLLTLITILKSLKLSKRKIEELLQSLHQDLQNEYSLLKELNDLQLYKLSNIKSYNYL